MPSSSSTMLYEEVQAAAAALRAVVPDTGLHKPLAGIVCGSGLGRIAERLRAPVAVPYKDIPGFSLSTVQGHEGKLVFGYLGETPVVCMLGRLHFYEGWTVQQTTFPIRTMTALGISVLIVTNAAGGLNPEFRVGDVMIIEDQIALPLMAGNTPLRGPNDERNGPRFPPISEAYPQRLRKFVASVAAKHNMFDINVRGSDESRRSLRSGTYAFVSGPQYETRAESRALRALGGDSVGMSTAPEVLVAAHAGVPVIGFSLITNEVLTHKAPTFETPEEEAADAARKAAEVPATHAEVLAAGKAHADRLLELVSTFVPRLPEVL